MIGTRSLAAASGEDGIAAVRNLLPQCWFDEKRCGWGLKALKNYRTEFSEKLGTYTARPVHDWASHRADAFRYLAIGLGQRRRKTPRRGSTVANGNYDVFRL